MPKSIHRAEYRILLRLLRELRMSAGVTQTRASASLGRVQSFVSDVERGVRRLDVVQLRDLCIALGTDLPSFVAAFERSMGSSRARKATK